MNKKNLWAVIGFTTLAAIVITMSKRTPPSAPSSLPAITVGYLVEVSSYAPVMDAYDNDYFTRRQVEARLLPLQNMGEMRQALAAGQIDIGMGSSSYFFPPIAEGAPIKIIAPLFKVASLVFVRPDDTINKFPDLRGKTIATRTPGGGVELEFRAALHNEGIDSADLNFVYLTDEQCLLALMDKKSVDASVVNESVAGKYHDAGAVLFREWESKGYVRHVLPGPVIVANTDFLREHETAAKRFLDGMIDAHRFIKEHPQEAAQVTADHIQRQTAGSITFSPMQVLETWQNGSFAYVVWSDPQFFADRTEIAREVGVIERSLTVDELFDLRFKDQLHAAQSEIYGTED